MSAKIGSRVGAVCSADKDTVRLYGYGVYEGDFIRPDDTRTPFGTITEVQKAFIEHYKYPDGTTANQISEEHKKALNSLLSNPRIRLDNGDVVWGCQCWWGSVDRVKGMIGDRKVEIVPVER
ncbi:MAG: hypothetical protein M0R50_11225 [Candidatus Cloacimonetes bacterium]|jgi:hypothetical protein|nr:hypothetical protein [Candidatus Cloacimonadota bacterium]